MEELDKLTGNTLLLLEQGNAAPLATDVVREVATMPLWQSLPAVRASRVAFLGRGRSAGNADIAGYRETLQRVAKVFAR